MSDGKKGHSTPTTQEIAQRGESIYRERYEREFVEKFPGKFVAIDVRTEEATVSNSAEDAVRVALEKDSEGFFHLIRVGRPAAFDAGWYITSVG
ncbi:MAG: hypothetical protein ACRD8A_00065 [Candidatus Acidiferrales bacterium]